MDDGDPGVAPKQMHGQALKGRTLPQLLAEIEQASRDRRTARAERTQLYMALKAVSYLMPDELPQLGAALDAAEPESLLFSIGVAALGQVGNAASQSVLRSLLKVPSEVSPLRSSRVMIALSSVPHRNKHPSTRCSCSWTIPKRPFG